MRSTLVRLEDQMNLLAAVVASGRLPSDVSIAEVQDEERCVFGRWVRGRTALTLDPDRAAETGSLHAAFHRMAASVLAEVRDGRIGEARRLLESDDGCAGTARRLDAALRSWIVAHCEWAADGAVDHVAASPAL